jgi:hypothetical protein
MAEPEVNMSYTWLAYGGTLGLGFDLELPPSSEMRGRDNWDDGIQGMKMIWAKETTYVQVRYRTFSWSLWAVHRVEEGVEAAHDENGVFEKGIKVDKDDLNETRFRARK